MKQAKPYQFVWLNDITFDFVQNVEAGCLHPQGVQRVCYIGCSASRVYLVYNQGFTFVPYVLENNVWQTVMSHRVCMPEAPADVFASEESLRKYMEHAMECQFPHSVETFWDEHPTRSAIESMLSEGVTISDLDTMHLVYMHVTVQEDEEWDGAVGISCEEGVLVIPYCKYEDGSEILCLQYTTFHPDSWLDYAVTLLEQLISKLLHFIGRFRWSNFRRHINER